MIDSDKHTALSSAEKEEPEYLDLPLYVSRIPGTPEQEKNWRELRQKQAERREAEQAKSPEVLAPSPVSQPEKWYTRILRKLGSAFR